MIGRRIASVVLLVVGVLARNFIARVAVETGVKKVTGFPLEIGVHRETSR